MSSMSRLKDSRRPERPWLHFCLAVLTWGHLPGGSYSIYRILAAKNLWKGVFSFLIWQVSGLPRTCPVTLSGTRNPETQLAAGVSLLLIQSPGDCVKIITPRARGPTESTATLGCAHLEDFRPAQDMPSNLLWNLEPGNTAGSWGDSTCHPEPGTLC